MGLVTGSGRSPLAGDKPHWIPGEPAVPTGTFGRPARRAGLSRGGKGKHKPPEEPNKLEIHERLVIGTGEEQLLGDRLHRAVDMKKDKLWQLLAAEFSELIKPEKGGEAGVPEEDFSDMSVEELASKLEFGVQPSVEQAAAEVEEVMEVN